MTRLYGRCEGGGRVYDDRPGNKGKNITLIGAMSAEGLIASMTFPGSLNTEVILSFYRTSIDLQQLQIRNVHFEQTEAQRYGYISFVLFRQHYPILFPRHILLSICQTCKIFGSY